MLLFFSVVSFFIFSLFSSDTKESFLFDSEGLLFKSFRINRKEKKFKDFYQTYFSDLMPYELMVEAVNRFSFLFHYMEARNIGSLDLKENKQIDLFHFKELREEEKIALVYFYLHTVELFAVFESFLDKKSVKNDFLNDSFCRAFLKFRETLSNLPKIEKMNHAVPDFSFFVKHVWFSEEEIKNNIASDIHSSPKYFGMEHQSLERIIYQDKKITSKEDLEDFYKEILPRMNKRERTFFCGDIGGRSTWDLFVRSIDFEKGKENHLIENKLHEKLYSMGIDFFSLVHAAYQLYCLHEGYTEDVIRFQVFGNHETEEINKFQDKKDYHLDHFSEMISFLRIIMLPTEINFFLKDFSTVVLRHAFFPQSLSPEIHKMKKVNSFFKVSYLVSCLPLEFKSDLPLSYVIKAGTITFNPQYWSDMVPDSSPSSESVNNVFNFDVLLAKENDSSDSFFKINPHRGYENIVSIERATEEGKKISIDNIIRFNGSDYFFSNSQLEMIKKSRWVIFFGHTHSLKTLWHSFCWSDNLISIHPYYFENKNSCSYFSLCSCHNDFFNAFQYLSHAFISKLSGWHKDIDQREPLYVVDFKQGTQVNILSTFFCQLWQRYKKINEIKNNIEESIVSLTKNNYDKKPLSLINKNETIKIGFSLYRKESKESIQTQGDEEEVKIIVLPKKKKIFKPTIITQY